MVIPSIASHNSLLIYATKQTAHAEVVHVQYQSPDAGYSIRFFLYEAWFDCELFERMMKEQTWVIGII